MKTQTLGSATRRALFAAAFCAAALPSLAEDWTVSANTTLTADTTVDALTVNSGVTLDLAGYSLTCTSLAGSGTITSTSVNFASPDTTEPYHVTWITKFGTGNDVIEGDLRNNDTTTPRKLFDGNTTNDGRILVDAGISVSRLPLAVTYDFGAGKKVCKYKIHGESSGSNYTARSPRDWTLEGSNDGSAWTEVDSRTGESWSNNQSREFTVDESKVASYRYYRMTFTASKSSQYLELNELYYFGAGELHVNTPGGATATVPYSVTITDKVKVVTEVNGGTVNATGDFYLGKNTGATGSMTVNSGTVTQTGNRTLFVGDSGTGTLTLNDGAVTMYYVRDGFTAGGSGTINLNGGTLSTQRIFTRSGATGELNFNGGTLKALAADSNTGGLVTAETSVNAGENGGTIDSGSQAITVGAAIHGTGAMRFKGGSSITLSGASDYTGGTTIELGTKIVTTDADAKAAILGNLTIDGRARTTAGTGIVVFEYSGLAGEDVPTPVYKNCGPGTTIYRDGDTLKVDFELPVWELTANATWSSLVATYGTPAADAVVSIESSGAYTLTIDEDVSVAGIAFIGTGASSSTLAVASDAMLSVTGDITGAYVLNNGTVVSDGTVGLKFDNASRGVFVVNSGALKAVGKKTPIVDAGMPITGDPDVTPRSNYLIDVKSGATYDVNGQTSVSASIRLAQGAQFISSTDANRDYGQTAQLILDGDSNVTAAGKFGIYYSAGGQIDLGSHTLTVNSASDKEFMLCNTTINGDGTIYVANGRFCTRNADSTGSDCTISIGTSGLFENNKHFTVKNFVNNGTISYASNWGRGELEITGRFESKKASFPKLTLTGPTVKATGAVATVLDTFKASGTVYIDATDIVSAIASGDVPVLTVPANSATSAATWSVINAGTTNAIAKWRTDEGGTTKTLYVCKPTGLMVIFR